MKKLLPILFFFLPFGLSAQSYLNLIVIQGESNAAGQAPNTLAPPAEIGIRPKVQITHNGTGSVVKFENLNIAASNGTGNNQLLAYDGTPKFSFELPMANQIDSGLLDNPTYLVKQGFPGSVIADWLPGGSKNAIFIESFDSAIAQMNRKGQPYRIFVWQTIGINDIGTGGAGPTPIDSFVARMGRYRDYIRTRYGRPDIQFLSTRFSNSTAFSGGFNFPAASAIDGMRAVDSRFHSIPCDGATYVSGQSPVHWDYHGMGTIAHNMLDTMLFVIASSGSTTPFSFTNLSSSTYIFNPGAGSEQWIGRQWDNASGHGVNCPAGNSVPGPSYYYRFEWKDIESDVAQGSYSWTFFDQKMHQAMDARQVFSLAVMPLCVGCVGGEIPTYLHNLMQAEPTLKDWFDNTDGRWIPNWNSSSYLTRWRALLAAIANHIATTSYQPAWSSVPIPYSKVFYQVDIRGYGNYGEWHAYPYLNDAGYASHPNAKPTQTTLDSVIQMNLTIFPNNPNMALIGGFDPNSASFMPAEVSYRLLTSANAWGQIGWRRDNWADTAYNVLLRYNPVSYNPGSGSVALQPLIMNKYKFAPISGEPLNGLTNNFNCGSPYCDFLNEVNTYHAAGIGNGNFNSPTSGTTQANYQSAMLASGYRIVLANGNMTTTPVISNSFNITLTWQNIGLAAAYHHWTPQFELRTTGGTVVFTGSSSFDPFLISTSGSTSVTDTYTMPTGIDTTQTYNLYLIIRDPNAYMVPLALAITGRNSDGSYLLRSGIAVAGSGGGGGGGGGGSSCGGDCLPKNPIWSHKK